jgi:1-acyl-sn-glycerol-3-phosphate acyltransferase
VTRIDTKLAGQGLGSRAAYVAVRNVLRVLLSVWCRLTVEGRENIPRSGPFILAPTHRSIIDTPVASAATRRRMRFMGADKWWAKNRQFGWLLSALGGFPVTRGTADREALKRCIAVLELGEALVLFPEGERKSGPTVLPLFDGAAYVAVKTGVPIVPVGIGGSEHAMPKGAVVVYPRKMHVVIGAPIHPPTTSKGAAQRSAVRDMTAEVYDAMQRLLDAANARCR